MATSAIAADLLRHSLQQIGSGGYCAFEGWVRDRNDGRAVSGLEYEAYQALAESEGERILDEALTRYEINDARCVHRSGKLGLGELAVWIGVAATHRDAAFRACRYIIDEVKHRLPIWKKELYLSGDTAWVACAHTDRAHLHEAFDADGDDHGGPGAVQGTFQPDYSRQRVLPQIGATGQAKLAASRVLVIGAGGLGCPVLSYLAGAGVGSLGIVDADTVDASNLHRQTLYTAADIGRAKVAAAAQRLRSQNPAVNIRQYGYMLQTADVLDVIADYDLVVECSDDPASKRLIGDATAAAGKPAIFASIYQYEGQLYRYDPLASTPCLRCWMPNTGGEAGSCAQAGVLGPVAGVLGSLQAMEALKQLLGLAPVRPELLLLNLLDLSLRRIEVPQGQSCTTRGGCAANAGQFLANAHGLDDLELGFDTLLAARLAGYRLIDLRTGAEIEAEIENMALDVPTEAIHFETLAAQPPSEKKTLLICARGRRSRDAVEKLRHLGHAQVYALRGGLAALRKEPMVESAAK